MPEALGFILRITQRESCPLGSLLLCTAHPLPIKSAFENFSQAILPCYFQPFRRCFVLLIGVCFGLFYSSQLNTAQHTVGDAGATE